MMIRFLKSLGLLLIALLLINCSNDEQLKIFSPPKLLQGSWKAPGEDVYMKLKISNNNLIEDNFSGAYAIFPHLNFNEEYSSDEFIIEETVGENSYEVYVRRKDGAIMNEFTGGLFTHRKYSLFYYNNQLVLALYYQGMANAYLVRE